MNRRKLLVALGAGALAAPFVSLGQQQPARIARIGFLGASSASGMESWVEALRAGLRERGYVEGKNIVIEFRWAEGKYERLPDFASELVRSKIYILLTGGTPAILAAKRATTTIPIVIVVGDALAGGIVTNLARPTENVTGSTYNSVGLYAKRLELIKETLPRAKQFGCLLNPSNDSSKRISQALENAAKALKIELHKFEARGPGEFETAFSAMSKKRVDAIVVHEESVFNSHTREIAGSAIKQRVASIGSKEFAEAGGLVGYGPHIDAMYGRMAYFVDRILKGAKVSDLPVEQASRLEMVINMKAAKTLGITIPQSIFVRADRVIE